MTWVHICPLAPRTGSYDTEISCEHMTFAPFRSSHCGTQGAVGDRRAAMAGGPSVQARKEVVRSQEPRVASCLNQSAD
jgi:hypothetical protein